MCTVALALAEVSTAVNSLRRLRRPRQRMPHERTNHERYPNRSGYEPMGKRSELSPQWRECFPLST